MLAAAAEQAAKREARLAANPKPPKGAARKRKPGEVWLGKGGSPRGLQLGNLRLLLLKHIRMGKGSPEGTRAEQQGCSDALRDVSALHALHHAACTPAGGRDR